MGLIRKTISMGTLGAVDFRSDKERTAAYTKAAKKEAKKQTKIMREQARSTANAPARPATNVMPTEAGWYRCPSGTAGKQRYWNGRAWTGKLRNTPPTEGQ